jgi:hypothetical protein
MERSGRACACELTVADGFVEMLCRDLLISRSLGRQGSFLFLSFYYQVP